MVKYRIEVYTHYANAEGTHYKSIFETEYYQTAVDKFNEINSSAMAEYDMTYNEVDLYNYDTCTYKHFFQISLVSQDFSNGGWKGLGTIIMGGLEKFIGDYKF